MNKEKMKRIRKGLFIFIVILTVGTMLRLFFVDDPKRRSTMVFQLAQYLAMLIILISPKIIKKQLKVNVPTELHFAVAIFAFLALVLGDAFNFYNRFPWWDSVLHFNSGIILSFVALWVIHLLMAERSKYIYLNKYFTAVFVVAFSLALGAAWEICEYTYDDIFKTNTQQYMKSTYGTLISQEDVPLQGHEALTDTIKDLALDLGGSLLVAGYGIIRYDEIKKIENDFKG